MSDELDLRTVLQEGDPDFVSALIASGKRFDVSDEHGYDAILHAVCGRDVARDTRLMDLLRVLVEAGVELNTITKYDESALRILSRIGRFDAVGFLLAKGADRGQLGWTPLIEAVALGSLEDVERLIRAGASLEGRDHWARTAWLVALLAGDLAKVRLLRNAGADVNARGRCAAPPLHYAVHGHHPEVVRWLLEIGQNVEQTDEFGVTPLMCAVENHDIECARLLIDAGANVNAENGGGHVLQEARSKEMVRLLLDAGANPRHLAQDGHRALCGLGPASQKVEGVTRAEFERGRHRRFGVTNPERTIEPFWEGMIRSGASAWDARIVFLKDGTPESEPTWCAQRFGQSTTPLPDGRVVQIAGEHEDHYDPDFCIYNDVFVHEPDGAIVIYSYPEASFPPTDFHTATLVGNAIYVIGSLGYHGRRRFGQTQVYRLDLQTFRMDEVRTWGDGPGWLYEQVAVLLGSTEIRVAGGKVATETSGREEHVDNVDTFVLNVETHVWHRDPRVTH
jgi:ankyrin repeat protein